MHLSTVNRGRNDSGGADGAGGGDAGAVPERFEGPGEVASNVTLGKVGTSGRITAASEGGLWAESSEQPSEGISWAIVQPGVPVDFVRVEHEEDEIWQEQLNLGGKMEDDIQCVLQLHWQEKLMSTE